MYPPATSRHIFPCLPKTYKYAIIGYGFVNDVYIIVFIYNDLVYEDDDIDIDRHMDEAERITNKLRMRFLISN